MQPRLTVQSLISDIAKLQRGYPFQYTSGNGECVITHVQLPEGPIRIKRRPHVKGGTGKPWKEIKEDSISTNMVRRYVNALNTGIPIHIDRILGASYNTRTVLETLAAACPQFFMCRPKRVTSIESRQVDIVEGHKHLIWRPGAEGHTFGEIVWAEDINGYITEVPPQDVYSEAAELLVTDSQQEQPILDPEINRIHHQMQLMLSEAASWMSLRSWVARQDHGICVKGKNILELPFMVRDLHDERVISNYPEAIKVASNIDCLWFNGGIPFVFEVEHTTGVLSGLNRMKEFHEQAPFLNSNFVVVAPDEDREDVLKKACTANYVDMDNLWFLPYSSLNELKGFSSRHQWRRGNRQADFIKMFMEEIPRGV